MEFKSDAELGLKKYKEIVSGQTCKWQVMMESGDLTLQSFFVLHANTPTTVFTHLCHCFSLLSALEQNYAMLLLKMFALPIQKRPFKTFPQHPRRGAGVWWMSFLFYNLFQQVWPQLFHFLFEFLSFLSISTVLFLKGWYMLFYLGIAHVCQAHVMLHMGYCTRHVLH